MKNIDRWPLGKLGDVCTAIRGVTFPSGEARSDEFDASIPCLTTSGVQTEIDWESCRFIPLKRVSTTTQLIRINDILVSTANSKALVGKSASVRSLPFRCTFGAFVTVLRPTPMVDPTWLSLWMRSYDAVSYFYKLSSNTTNISNLRVSDLLSLDIPLPSLSEQQRIAAILTKQMVVAERGQVAAEIQLKTAQSLRAAYIRSMFESNEAKAWPRKSMGSISSLITDGPHVTPSYVPKGIPFVTVRNIVNRVVDFSNVSYVSLADHTTFTKRAKAERGDILYTKDGTLGIPCVVDTDVEFSFFVSVALIKLAKDIADSYFVAFALEAPEALNQVEQLGAGAGLKHMVLKSIRALEIPLPPLSEQQRIAAILKEKMTTVIKLCQTIDDRNETLDNLPASLLRKAFSGNL